MVGTDPVWTYFFRHLDYITYWAGRSSLKGYKQAPQTWPSPFQSSARLRPQTSREPLRLHFGPLQPQTEYPMAPSRRTLDHIIHISPPGSLRSTIASFEKLGFTLSTASLFPTAIVFPFPALPAFPESLSLDWPPLRRGDGDGD